MVDRWPIFLCYRQTDGMASAARVFTLLDDQPVPVPDETDPGAAPPRLDVYFDQAAPGVEDWQAVHEPYLKRARAIVVICTPGAKLKEGKTDWVHREIDWWLANREMAPLLVDPLGADLRYVPSSIAARWPNAQRIKLIEKDWDGLTEAERIALDERVRAQFLGAIVPSAERFYRQELELEEGRAARIARIRRAAAGLAMGFVIVLATAIWIYLLWNAAQEAAHTAETARQEAEQASRLAQTRVLEGQLARTRTEAELLGILQEFDKYDAYKDTIKQWEDDFRARASAIAAIANDRLPSCERFGGFNIYEGQLLEMPFEGLAENEAMFAFLAVVPGSSPERGDWAPAVLDVFFADRGALSARRNLNHLDVKRVMESVPLEDQWGLLIGLGTPHVLTHGGRNYRIRRTNIRMNDQGDMVMAFDICLEVTG
jgi:hypothetical protein